MKKGIKTLLTVMFAAALVVNAVPDVADAAADNTAYLAYADEAWTYQYWGDPVDTGVVGTNAEITGPGQYTVGLDFTATADGKALGLAFTAPIIAGGNVNFPGYFFQLDSIVINGAEVEFTKNYTSSDDGMELRSNIYNTWVAALPDDARTPDGSLDGASAVIVDPTLFTEVETITVTFTLLDAEGNAGVEAAVPQTGVVSMALIYGLGALATGAVVLKKRTK